MGRPIDSIRPCVHSTNDESSKSYDIRLCCGGWRCADGEN